MSPVVSRTPRGKKLEKKSGPNGEACLLANVFAERTKKYGEIENERLVCMREGLAKVEGYGKPQ
jgi:hypothetical protein